MIEEEDTKEEESKISSGGKGIQKIHRGRIPIEGNNLI
jgi:hypothetical protein